MKQNRINFPTNILHHEIQTTTIPMSMQNIRLQIFGSFWTGKSKAKALKIKSHEFEHIFHEYNTNIYLLNINGSMKF